MDLDRVEERKQYIFEQVGEEALQVLKDTGLDVDAAVTRIVAEQEKKRENLELQAEFGTINDVMTSELVKRSQGLDDVYGKEYARRLGLIGFDGEQAKKLYDQEALILSSDIGIFEDHRSQPWVRRYFFVNGVKPDQLPEPGQMTLSELILITDDASSAWIRDHHALSEETWAAVGRAAIQAHSFGGAQYATAFKDRVEALGWSQEQDGAYTKNECLLTERLKWGHHENPAWTEESTNLEQCKR